MARLSGLAVFAVALAAFNADSRAAFVTYTATLSGPAESPPNASPGIGFAEVDYDSVAHTLRIQVTFSGLLGTTTASHIHSATSVPRGRDGRDRHADPDLLRLPARRDQRDV